MNKHLPATLIFHNNNGPFPEANVRKDGMTVVQAPAINWVCLFDLAKVREHRINEVMGTVSHAVYFRNGGHLFYSYGVDGSGPIELQGEGVDMHHVGQGMVMVMPTLDLMPDVEGWQSFPPKRSDPQG